MNYIYNIFIYLLSKEAILTNSVKLRLSWNTVEFHDISNARHAIDILYEIKSLQFYLEIWLMVCYS